MAGSTHPDRCQRLRLARRRCGLTQQQLARAMHRSLSSVKEWERGSAPKTLDCVVRLCDLLRISLDWYVTGRGQMRPAQEPQDWLGRMARASERLSTDERELLLMVAQGLKGQGVSPDQAPL